ncbi:tRNA dihydrouridine synthase DusB [Prochlorococcus sp. MIT 1307]|uniref:tRNA dihydrouridine synthase DusB n=1 Tax=Prochlorococcus sp. MIT 1307 TaxID=3096219 RepID=UPI002A75C2CD|nr:tRNA dihydrouridine synthase DusB [Prochlorococcus sp. MIT 1307]
MTSHTAELIIPGKGRERKLHSRVLQSPLAGVSDQVFRKLVRRWAPESLLFTEMVSAQRLERGHSHYKIEELSSEKGPIGVQLFDTRPTSMVEAAIKAEACGAFLIDINMGCPAKKVTRKGGGSGLLKEPELAEILVSKVANAIQIPVTVKTRLTSVEDASCNPVSFALRLQNAGAQLLTIHGRTRAQGFSGQANWNTISKIKNALTIPVIANGDVQNADDALRCLSITGADGVMIGRGSMGAPWLVGEIDWALRGKKGFKVPGAKEKVSLALEQLEGLLESRGENGLHIARKHMSWTCKGFSGANSLRYSLVRAKTAREAKTLLKKQLLSLN